MTILQVDGESWNLIDEELDIVDAPSTNGSAFSSKVASPSVISLSDDEVLLPKDELCNVATDDELNVSESCNPSEDHEIDHKTKGSVNVLNIDDNSDAKSEFDSDTNSTNELCSSEHQMPEIVTRVLQPPCNDGCPFPKNLEAVDTCSPTPVFPMPSIQNHTSPSEKSNTAAPVSHSTSGLPMHNDKNSDESSHWATASDECDTRTGKSETEKISSECGLLAHSVVDYYINEAEFFKGKARAAVNELYRISSELSLPHNSPISPNNSQLNDLESIGLPNLLNASAFNNTMHNIPKAADSLMGKLYEFSEIATDKSMWVAQEINRRTNEAIDHFNIDKHEQALEALLTNALGAMSALLEPPSSQLLIDTVNAPPMHKSSHGVFDPIEDNIAHTLVVSMEKEGLPRFDGSDFYAWISLVRPHFELWLIPRAEIYLTGIRLYSDPPIAICLERVVLPPGVSVEEMLTRLHNFFEGKQIYDNSNELTETNLIYI